MLGTSLWKRLIRGVGLSFIGRILSAGLGYGSTVVAARLLSLNDFGVYMFATSLLGISYIVANLGTENTLLYLVPRSHHRDGTLGSTIATGLLYVIVGSVAVSLVIVALLPEWGYLVHDKSLSRYLQLLVLSIPLQAVTAYFRVCQQATLSFTRAVVPENFVRPAALLSSLLVGWLVNTHSVGFVCVCYLASYALSAVLSGIWFWSSFYKELFVAKFSINWTVVTTSPQFMLSQLMNQIPPFVVTSLLGLMGNASIVGLFRAAQQTAGLIGFALRSCESAYVPVLTRLLEKSNPTEVRMAYRVFVTAVLLVGGILCTLLMVNARLVFSVFGYRFIESSGMFLLLALGQLLNAGVGSPDYLLMMSGRRSAVTLASGIQVAWTCLVANLVIRSWGGVGAAVAVASGMAVYNIVLFVMASFYTGVSPTSKEYLGGWIALACNWLFCSVVTQHLVRLSTGCTLLVSLLASMACLTLYYVWLRRFHDGGIFRVAGIIT
ncbi:MAG: oligosaccharide flippase family protein [Alicyclobacillus sp.]|nr:oligosaccharide flippase family protein [Alicyclobacillus sp.]